MAVRRRASRKLALNMLYEHEIGGRSLEEILARQSSNPAFEFAAILARGVSDHQSELDDRLSKEAIGWAPDRMPAIDRILMRIATFEMLYLKEVPHAVSINEAVELAKIYSTEESSSFINGVLGSLWDQLTS